MMPVFIAGCERSGTTLLGAMLGAHKECVCVPESQFKVAVLKSSRRENGTPDLAHALNTITNHWRFKLWNLNIDLRSVSPKEIGSSYSDVIEWIIEKYAENRGKTTARIWIDHTPSNRRYAATLFEFFPEARLIHIIRDGRAVASSVMPLDWGPNTIDRAARFWVERVAYGLAAESFWGEKRITRVKYEDLVGEPETTLKKLCSYLDIDYQPEMAHASGFQTPSYTSRQHALVGKNPDPTRARSWEETLTSRQVEIFESLTGELLRYLGYDLRYGAQAREMTTMEELASLARESYRQVINRFRLQLRRGNSIAG